MRPDDVQLRMAIATTLLMPRPDLARPYVEQAAKLTPEDPNVLIMLGMIQGLNDQVREAKRDTLQGAAKLARKQGKRDLAQHANEMRGLVGTPMLRTMLQMSLLSDELGGFDELDDDDFDLDGLEGFLDERTL